MGKVIQVLAVAIVFASTLPIPQAGAAAPSRLLPTAQNPQKPETCRPKWPYVMLTCVA